VQLFSGLMSFSKAEVLSTGYIPQAWAGNCRSPNSQLIEARSWADPIWSRAKTTSRAVLSGVRSFVERYGNADTSENFVDAIIHGLQTWSNIDLSSQRGALLDAYNSGLNQDDSRRLVLRLVIQDVGFLQAEYNRSFVLMQYFGYLQRDPDVGGYEFWLDVINNREPNNYRGMVLRVRHVGRIPAPLQLAGDSK